MGCEMTEKCVWQNPFGNFPKPKHLKKLVFNHFLNLEHGQIFQYLGNTVFDTFFLWKRITSPKLNTHLVSISSKSLYIRSSCINSLINSKTQK